MDQSTSQLTGETASDPPPIGLVVLVPTRGRPHQVKDMVLAFQTTCGELDTHLCFLVDWDDPERNNYLDTVDGGSQTVSIILVVGGSMVAALNEGAHAWLTEDIVPGTPYALGFMGDDHRPKVKGWDTQYLAALRQLGSGMVYGNDMVHGANLPTQVAITSDIISQLGWMAPPTLKHLFVDNAWLALGRGAQCITYLPTVIVEHVHPITGKVPWDERYKIVNSGKMQNEDSTAYAAWVDDKASAAGFDACVYGIKRLRGMV